MHRLRGGAPVLTGPEDLPQSWVPRVVNLALAAFFLAFLIPLAQHLSGRSTVAQVLLLLIAVPFGLLTVTCLSSAVRPGSVGRFARRLRQLR